MSAEDALRLAWVAHRAGNSGRRDALLTLAAADAGERGAPWVGAVRDFLVHMRPDHLFAGFERVSDALADPRVAQGITRLRYSFPRTRIRWLVERSEIARGPRTGRKTSASVLLNDLLSSSPYHRRRRAERSTSAPVPAPPKRAARPTPDVSQPSREALSVVRFYLRVLLSVAVLCEIVSKETGRDQRAA